MLDLKPFFSLCAARRHIFCSMERGRRNRQPKWSGHFVGRLPTLFFVSAFGNGLSRNTARLYEKGCLPFRGQKPHASRPFFFSFGPEKTVQESSCFIEHPLHTQSGLRAGSPRARKAFQGSPMTRPAYSWTFGAWIGSTDLPCGFCWYCSPSLSKRPIHRLYIAAAKKSPPFPLSLL